MNAKGNYCILIIFPMFLLFCLFQSKYCCASLIYNITLSQALSQGQTLVSLSRKLEFGFFSPTHSANQYVGIWYRGKSAHRVLWVANRENPLRVKDSLMASVMINHGGNLEVMDGNRNSVWSTNVQVVSNSSVAVLLDNGNLLLQDAVSGEHLWQSFDHLVDAYFSGSVLGFNTKTGRNSILTSWKDETDPSLGDYSVGIAKQIPAQCFVWVNGSIPHWRSGPWNKLRFVGVPEMGATYQNPLSIEVDRDAGTTYLYYKWYNSSTDSSLVISAGGVLKAILKDGGGDWYTAWEAPKSRCDFYGVCGISGVCKASGTPICNCLKGFVPKSSQEWSKGNWTNGCVRQRQLRCDRNVNGRVASQEGKRSDGFWKIGNVKVPDFYEFVELSVFANADGCQSWCLNNCSCVAYSFVVGIGCLVWPEGLTDLQVFPFGGEDLFIRLAHEEIAGRQRRKKTIISVIVVSSLAIIALGFRLQRLKARQKGKGKQATENFELIMENPNPVDTMHLLKEYDPPELLPHFDFCDILVATKHFSPINKLGQGGFGPVYKGILKDGKEIAVKRLSSNSGQGIKEFKNEMILISKLQHRNLVRLLGCCTENQEKLLVYEYMPNKSLDLFIFDSKKGAQINWATRFNIIHGIARGLTYLHRDSCLRVIHRDLKLSNILLDAKMNPKISDFGLACMFQGTVDLKNTQRVVGTLGYMSPEYALAGMFSDKSDVFSFGVLMLEILSGRKNTSFHYYDKHLCLIAYAWNLWSEGRGQDMVDKVLGNSYSSAEAMRCIHIALLCVQDHGSDRPTMPDIVVMLSNETDRPQPKQPLFSFQISTRCEFRKENDSQCSVNEATISTLVGR